MSCTLLRCTDLFLLFLDSALHVGDLLKTNRVEICYDSRAHPTESIMSPLMSELQGPGLLLRFPNVRVDADTVIRMLSSASNGEMKTGTHHDKGRLCFYGMWVDSTFFFLFFFQNFYRPRQLPLGQFVWYFRFFVGAQWQFTVCD